MKVVIDIPEDVYRRLKAGDTNAGNTFHNTALEAVGNGIPLPKGHGDLIDRSVLQEQIHNSRYSDDFCAEHNIDRSINFNVVEMAIANVPTVIETDKNSEMNI